MEDLSFRCVLALLMSLALAVRAFLRKSVDLTGVAAGIPVMVVHMVAGYRFAALLLVFFFTSSKVTRVGEEKKREIEAEFKEGGQRNWRQVLANSMIASILLVILLTITRGLDSCLDTGQSKIITGLVGGVIGHYACCNGDTWSSELGILSNSPPRLITTFKIVRRGTNGGITRIGLVAATFAGFVIGTAFVLVGLITTQCSPDVAWRQLLAIPVAAFAGLCGSLIDSVIGATLQYSGYCTMQNKVVDQPGATVVKISGKNILDNNAVNAASVLFTTLLTSLACLYIF
ncbi:hypothetical protein AXF42_Ash007276 [Apostasia shenzhenica]|uniref:Transmembrane protein 19 n=1 Tax=Apostasia shenzhenica TaxID=1088818 RepID=A0A2I0B9U3_9ASPA|nr:hypothetical protein AXF42_Ash007276 [Apostasia shenzhenica]